jgi:hypothetical protein
MELEDIMENVKAMRIKVFKDAPLKEIMDEFIDFKRNCPKLFELVLENKEDYMPVLLKMEKAAKMVNEGKATKKEMDGLVDFRLTEQYVLPALDMNDNVRQEIAKHMEEVEELEARLNFNSRPDDEDPEIDS